MRWRSSSPTPAARMSGGTAAPIMSRPANGRRSASAAARSTSPGARRQDRTLRRAAAIEFVVAAGSGGGRGWIAVDDLEIVPLPEPPAVPPPVAARRGMAARARWTGTARPSGRPSRTTPLDPRSRLSPRIRRAGAALGGGAARRPIMTLRLSDDGRVWREVRSVRERRRRHGLAEAARKRGALRPHPAAGGLPRRTAVTARPRSRSARSPSAPATMRSSPRSRRRPPRGDLSARLRRRAELLDPGRHAGGRPERPDRRRRRDRGRPRRLFGRALRRSTAAAIRLGRRRARRSRCATDDLPIPTVARHGGGWTLDDHRHSPTATASSPATACATSGPAARDA